MNPNITKEALVFDSKFESGNLDMVMKPALRSNYYYLYMRPDANSNGHLHWFYFSISGCPNGQTITLNLSNFTKYTRLFEQGLKPSVFSWQKYKNRQIGWHRGGKNLKYTRITRRGRVFYTLEFEYRFEYENDTVWFATSIPYTYSTL